MTACSPVTTPLDLDIAGLTRLLADEQAVRDLRLYFGVGLARGELSPFTGGRFELFDGGGDRPETRHRFTAADIFAVQLLSVDVPAVTALDLIEGGLGGRAADLLAEGSAGVRVGA